MNGERTRIRSGVEAAKRGRNGGIASGKVRQERKALREAVRTMLSMPAIVDGEQLINPFSGEPYENIQAALIVSTLRRALDGDVKAAGRIVEWLGEDGSTSGVVINVSLGKNA